MKILVYGVGGVGGYFGGKLSQTEHQITLIARGSHLKAIQENGLQVKSITGNFKVTPYLATDNLDEIEPPDLVVFAVKSWQLPAVAKTIKPYCHSNTLLLPLQNGVYNIAKLSKVFPSNQIIGGLCRIISYIEKPGVITHPAFNPSVIFGEQDNTYTARIRDLKAVFDSAGIDATIAADIDREIWKKFLFICTISGIGGLTRVPIGTIRTSDYLLNMMYQTAHEIVAIAQAKGVDLNPADIEATFEAIHNQDPNTTASTQRDIMDGKPSELEDFNGFIVSEGTRLGIPTKINQFIFECLLPQEQLVRSSQ